MHVTASAHSLGCATVHCSEYRNGHTGTELFRSAGISIILMVLELVEGAMGNGAGTLGWAQGGPSVYFLSQRLGIMTPFLYSMSIEGLSHCESSTVI